MGMRRGRGDQDIEQGTDYAESSTPVLEEGGEKAIVKNRTDGSYPQTAIFGIRGARQRAGDWINTVKKDLEKRFGNVEIETEDDDKHKQKPKQKTESKSKRKDDNESEGTKKKKNVFDKMGKGLEHIHPLNVMNENIKEKLKDTAKGNKGKIAGLLIEASIYCCVFDISKRGLKKVTENRKYTGPTVRFISDVAFPNGLYGPIFGFLLRLSLPF